MAVVTFNNKSIPVKIIKVNDGEIGEAPFTFEFFGGWVHEGGYLNRFEGGDEHWITPAQYGKDFPSFKFRFIGSRIALYGHKVPTGAVADVLMDGEKVGEIDYSSPAREEGVTLWESDCLPHGEHTATVVLTKDGEASIDSADVVTLEDLPVASIEMSARALLLEPDMSYDLAISFLPSYATKLPKIKFKSSDETVAKVDENGKITALSAGQAEITASPTRGKFKGKTVITVRKPIGGDLVVTAGDANLHTCQRDYFTYLEQLDVSKATLFATLWKKDIANAKINLLTKAKEIKNIYAKAENIVNEKGEEFKGKISVLPVRNSVSHTSNQPIPDVLGGNESYDLPAYSVGSLWVRAETDEFALAGNYSGEIVVYSNGERLGGVNISVEVINLVCPENTAALELWQYPYSSNRYYSGKASEEYFGNGAIGSRNVYLDEKYTSALRSQIELYAKAGGKTLTVTVVEDPWNSQTPDPYPSMIKWTQNKDGSFSFDYTDFDYWVALNEEHGVDGGIMSFSIAEWANRITYFDANTNTVISESLTPGSERWKTVWTEFLTDYMKHTMEKGWFNRVYMSMDERPAELVEKVLDLVESVRNEKGECFKTSLAVFTFETEYMFNRITDLSLAIYMDAEKLKAISKHRRELGLITTLYTCGAQYSALENPPFESLYTLWYCEKMGADGFLRWALDAFNQEPLVNSNHRLFASGDLYLIYPDKKDAKNPIARSAPRFEKLAEGCRDISKLRYLATLSKDFEKEVKEILENVGKTDDLKAEAEKAQKALNDLAKRK